MATLPPESFSAMMPEPMTTANKSAVPSSSASHCWGGVCVRVITNQLCPIATRASLSAAGDRVSSGSDSSCNMR